MPLCLPLVLARRADSAGPETGASAKSIQRDGERRLPGAGAEVHLSATRARLAALCAETVVTKSIPPKKLEPSNRFVVSDDYASASRAGMDAARGTARQNISRSLVSKSSTA
jgi:hypothetical protein